MSMAVVLAFQAVAQQDAGPILRPRMAPTSTLLVICDLACSWRLDGEVKGQIDAGRAAKAKVDRGQHVVIAMTEDGADQVRHLCEVKSSGQTVIDIELQPVRSARLKEQEERDRASQEMSDLLHIWTDLGSGLMWQKKDSDAELDWYGALQYCKEQQSGGFSDWRLPYIDELQSIYDPSANVQNFGINWHVKGRIAVSGGAWSNSIGRDSHQAWFFYFQNGGRVSYPVDSTAGMHALCVRRAI
jgi:hypothetical protein